MSSDTADKPIIAVRNLSKKYPIYGKKGDRLKEAFHPLRKKFHRDFWALKNVSFDVSRGEAFGIIGVNGSGKSTLLGIICGVLRPSEGEDGVRGKVSALLELGSGFNPEFTGRENVYLQGAILGYSREQIEKRFNSIAAFDTYTNIACLFETLTEQEKASDQFTGGVDFFSIIIETSLASDSLLMDWYYLLQ